MPELTNNYNIVLTTSAVNITLPTTDFYTQYIVKTAAPLTILGTTNIDPSGTVYEGLIYNFKYLANITGGTVSIFGHDVPTNLLDKDFDATAIYTGGAWYVTIEPNFLESGVITTEDLAVNPGTHVSAVASSAGYVSANVAGVQVLQTVSIPADTVIYNAGSPFQGIRITACGNSTAASKDITITINEGTHTQTVFANNVQTMSGGWKIDVLISLTPATNVWQSEAMINTVSGDTEVWFGNGSNYYTNLTKTVSFNVTETVPAGGLVTLRSLRVEKIIA